MKTGTRNLLLGLVLLGLCPASSWASDFALYGTYWNTSEFDEGVGGGVLFGPSIGHSNWDFELRGAYLDDVARDSGPFDFEIHVLPVELGFAYNFAKEQPVNFYLGAGGGYYFLDTNVGQIDDEIGYYGVAGLQTGKKTAFFVEGNYRWMQSTVTGVASPGNPSVDEDVEFDMNGAGVNMGVVWRW